MGDEASSIHRPHAIATVELLTVLAASPNTYGYFMSLGDSDLNSERAYTPEEVESAALKDCGLLSDTADGHRLTELGEAVREACLALTDAAITIDEWEPLFRLLPAWDETILSRSRLRTAECVSGSAFTGNRGADELLRRVRNGDTVLFIDPQPAHRQLMADEGADIDIILTESSIAERPIDEWTPPCSPPSWYRYTAAEHVDTDVHHTVSRVSELSLVVVDGVLLLYIHDADDPYQSVLLELPDQRTAELVSQLRSLRTGCAQLEP